jgi:hypothetical protein
MKLAALLLVFGMAISAFAQETKSALTAPKFESCATQVQLYCQEQKIPGDVLKCLFQHMAELSSECKQEMQRAARASSQASERGGGALSAFGSLNALTPPIPILTYEGRYSPGATTMNEDKVNFTAPVYQTDDDYMAASLAAGRVHLGGAPMLGSGAVVPNDLYRIEVGTQYKRTLPAFKTWGLRASVGYAGDQVFENLKDTTFSLSANYGYPNDTGGFWIWSVFISNNSPFGNYVPIPGVLYIYKTPTFTGMFGFPILSMQWTAAKPWAYSVSMFGPTIALEAAYGDVKEGQYFAGANWSTQSFLLSKRVQDKDRFSIEEKKASLGFRTLVFGRVLSEVQAGYAFDRLMYMGQGFRNMQLGAANIGSDWFVSWNFKAGF